MIGIRFLKASSERICKRDLVAVESVREPRKKNINYHATSAREEGSL